MQFFILSDTYFLVLNLLFQNKMSTTEVDPRVEWCMKIMDQEGMDMESEVRNYECLKR